MLTFMLMAALNCPITKMVNTSGLPWNAEDKKVMQYCTKRCSQIYPRSPCLKIFTKKAKQDYTVICGK